MKIIVFILVFLFSTSIAFSEFETEIDTSKVDLFSLSLEELMNVRVTSVSKKAEKQIDIASSIYVITEEDIRRCAGTRLQDALMLVPGIWFDEMTYNYNSNSIRSNSTPFSRLFLVILDGVPIASPLTAGMLYNAIDIPLMQIERIEVIKGPGGAIYGANAVTGVISIFTKQAKDSEGVQVSLNSGTPEYISPFIRYGRKISDKTYVSAYANFKATRGYNKTKLFDGNTVIVSREGLPDTLITNKFPSNETDGRIATNIGVNFQYLFSDKTTAYSRFNFSNVESKVYTSKVLDPTPFIFKEKSTNILFSQRINHNFNENHSLFADIKYYSNNFDFSNGGGYNATTSLFDIEIQDNIKVGIHNISFGSNYRMVNFDIEQSINQDINFQDSQNMESLYAAFVQDKISYKDFIDLTFGVKAEVWTLVSKKIEYSPNIKLAIKLKNNTTIWGAFSRSIAISGYIHTKVEQRLAQWADPTNPDKHYCIALIPGADLKTPEFLTYELGLRTKVNSKLFFDLSGYYGAFHNNLNIDFIWQNKQAVPSEIFPDRTILPIYYANTSEGKFYGGEFVCKIFPSENKRLEVSYSIYKRDEYGLPIPGDTTGAVFSIANTEHPATPMHIIRFRPYIDFPEHNIYITFNILWASKYDKGDKFNYITQTTDNTNGIWINPPENQIQINFQIEKKMLEGKLNIFLWGRNILADEQVGYYSSYVPIGYPHAVHRTFGAGITWNLE